jgi:hypothetical protein
VIVPRRPRDLLAAPEFAWTRLGAVASVERVNARRVTTLGLPPSVATACATATASRADFADVPAPDKLAYEAARSSAGAS